MSRLERCRGSSERWRRNAFLASALCLTIVACRGPAPDRLVVDADTLVVNGPRAIAAPIRGVTIDGRIASRSRMQWSGTSRVARVSRAGDVTCQHKGDALVTASRGAVSAHVVVLCRPIAAFGFASGFPMRVYVGGPPQGFLIQAFDSDKAPVRLTHASALIDDSTIAHVDGGLLRGVSLGTTRVKLDFDGIEWSRMIEVDEKVAYDTLRLVGGQMKTYRVAPDGWYEIQLYRADSADHGPGLEVGSYDANCARAITGGFHYYCIARAGTSIVVQNSLPRGRRSDRVGILTIFRKPRERQTGVVSR
jgi:hypothetical protein